MHFILVDDERWAALAARVCNLGCPVDRCSWICCV